MKAHQLVALLLVGSIFALNGLRQFFIEPLAPPLSNTLWFMLQTSPLLAVLPGVLRGSSRGYFYALLVAMLYFVHGVLLTATPDSRTIGLWETGFATGLVAVGALAMRRLNRG
jgi:uncharacterized membrane protein